MLLESAFEAYAVCSACSDDDRLENVAQLRTQALVLQILKKELDVKKTPQDKMQEQRERCSPGVEGCFQPDILDPYTP